MAFPPNQTSARGDVKALTRAAWYDATSLYTGIAGGKTYYPGILSFGGHSDFNYDDAEGWAPRINYWGSTETKPYDNITYSSTNDTELAFKSYGSGLISLRRKNEGAVGSTTGTSGRVIAITNGRTSGEVYTQNYANIAFPYTNQLMCKTPPGGSWYCSYYARKSTSDPSNNNTVGCSIYIFGLKYDNNYQYDFSGHSGGDATGTTIANPDTGHTYYWSQNTLTTAWTKYEMAFTFDAAQAVTHMSIRLDNDNGLYGTDGFNVGSKIYIDRITLHPFDIALGASEIDDDGNPDPLDDAVFGTYAT